MLFEGPETLNSTFLSAMYTDMEAAVSRALGPSREVQQLEELTGPVGDGPTLPCSPAWYGKIVEAVGVKVGAASLADLARRRLTVVEAGYGRGLAAVYYTFAFKSVIAYDKDKANQDHARLLWTKYPVLYKSTSDAGRPHREGFTFSWPVEPPNFFLADFSAMPMHGLPSPVHLYVGNHGAGLATLINTFQVLWLDKCRPSEVLVALALQGKAQLHVLKKIGALRKDESNLLRLKDGTVLKMSSSFGTSKHPHLAFFLDAQDQQNVMEGITKHYLHLMAPGILPVAGNGTSSRSRRRRGGGGKGG